MSFTGSINSDVRRWFGNIAPKLNKNFIVVGCSGNFTVEQLITRNTNPKYIWSNDVTLYSSILGAYLCGEEFDLTISDKEFSFIEPFLESTESKAATILLMSEALKYEKCKNPFEERIWNHYKSNFKSYHDKTIIKIRDRKQKVKIDKYTAKDIADLLNEIPKESIVIAFMPTADHEWEHGVPGGINWVIVGGESGPGARPMAADWVRKIRDDCVQAGVPFFFKQWGGVDKKKAGRLLDGRTWDEIPGNKELKGGT